jgi:hypothetical protein
MTSQVNSVHSTLVSLMPFLLQEYQGQVRSLWRSIFVIVAQIEHAQLHASCRGFYTPGKHHPRRTSSRQKTDASGGACADSNTSWDLNNGCCASLTDQLFPLCQQVRQECLTTGDNILLTLGIIAPVSSCCEFLCRVIYSCCRTTRLLPSSD